MQYGYYMERGFSPKKQREMWIWGNGVETPLQIMIYLV